MTTLLESAAEVRQLAREARILIDEMRSIEGSNWTTWSLLIADCEVAATEGVRASAMSLQRLLQLMQEELAKAAQP